MYQKARKSIWIQRKWSAISWNQRQWINTIGKQEFKQRGSWQIQRQSNIKLPGKSLRICNESVQ